MAVFVTCKNEEDSIKMKALEWPQHHKFSDAQGQMIP